MPKNPYQTPGEIAPKVDSPAMDEPRVKTLRLWILPAAFAGAVSGFAFSIALLSQFPALRDYANYVLGVGVVMGKLTGLLIAAHLFEPTDAKG